MRTRTYRGPRVDATILGAASMLALAMGNGSAGDEPTRRFEVVHPAAVVTDADPALAGVWISADHEVRLQLNPDASYESSVAGRKRVAHGGYTVTGTSLRLHDDSGLNTTVTIFDGNLEMAGHTLFKH